MCSRSFAESLFLFPKSTAGARARDTQTWFGYLPRHTTLSCIIIARLFFHNFAHFIISLTSRIKNVLLLCNGVPPDKIRIAVSFVSRSHPSRKCYLRNNILTCLFVTCQVCCLERLRRREICLNRSVPDHHFRPAVPGAVQPST